MHDRAILASQRPDLWQALLRRWQEAAARDAPQAPRHAAMPPTASPGAEQIAPCACPCPQAPA